MAVIRRFLIEKLILGYTKGTDRYQSVLIYKTDVIIY